MGTTTTKAGRHARWRRSLHLGIAALIVVLVTRTGGLGWKEITSAAELLAHLDPLPMTAVLVCEIAWAVTLSRTQRSAVLAVGGKLGRRQALRISMAGFTFSRVVPGGGAAGGLFAMRELTRLGHPAAAAVTAMVGSWATSIVSLALLVFGGLITVAALGTAPSATVVPAAAALAALAALGGVLLRALHDDRLRRRLVELVDRPLRHLPFGSQPVVLERLFNGVDDQTSRGRHLWHSFGWATAAWLSDAAALWLVFAACGHRLSLTVLLVGYGSANLLNSLPELTPGWLGVFEAALSTVYITLGVPAGVAVAAVLIYRLASFWLPVAAGVIPAVRSIAPARALRVSA